LIISQFDQFVMTANGFCLGRVLCNFIGQNGDTIKVFEFYIGFPLTLRTRTVFRRKKMALSSPVSQPAKALWQSRRTFIFLIFYSLCLCQPGNYCSFR